jgi:3-hydroxybutyryl-CoA dehydratase
MQDYLLQNIEIGLTHSFEVEINESHIQKFLDISGDSNPMHIDVKYAKSKGMKDRVVYGMHTSAFYSTLVGVYIPGKYALLHSIEIGYIKPVFIGDKLIIEGVVSSVNKLLSDESSYINGVNLPITGGGNF